MNKYSKYYPSIEKNKLEFEQILNTFKNNEMNIEQKLNIANGALKFATYRSTGYYYSTVLENFFINIANNIDIPTYDIDFESNSILHVLTVAYTTGGHSRIVEKWIKQSDKNEKHSVAILNQTTTIPTLLKQYIQNRNGELIIFDNSKTQIEKALQLRELGMKYEKIILHTHMDDATATIAFGTNKFTRPIILFNHADHMFWIGISIADIVADLQKEKSISESKRNITNTFKLGIGSDIIQNNLSKEDSRKVLNIPSNVKVILTIGDNPKYSPVDNDSIYNALKNILENEKNAILYAIGPNKNQVIFKKLKKIFHNRIIITGKLDYHKEYLMYLKSADLIIDSYPIKGFTVGIDAVSQNIPFLSLDGAFNQLDFITNSEGNCKTEDELSQKALKILSDEQYYKEIQKKQKNLFNQECPIDIWGQRIKELYNITPKKHKVKNLLNQKEPVIIDDKCVILEKMYNTKKRFFKLKNGHFFIKRQGLPYIFEILTEKTDKNIYKEIRILSFPVFSYVKNKN